MQNVADQDKATVSLRIDGESLMTLPRRAKSFNEGTASMYSAGKIRTSDMIEKVIAGHINLHSLSDHDMCMHTNSSGKWKCGCGRGLTLKIPSKIKHDLQE